jgi:spoIIIJ-associated protein
MERKDKKITKETTEDILRLLEIEGTFKVSENKEEKSIDIIIDTKDSGIVIGRHGDILESLQLILSLAITKRVGKFIRVSVEVGDYKKNRIEWLRGFAEQTKEKVLEQGREIAVPNLRAWERRIVHLFLQDDKEVVSESQGEGRDRVLVIKPRV